MPFITQEMVDAATAEVSNAYDADIIQSLGGLGGCRTMEEAPPEVAKWFNRDVSVAEIMFTTMDPLCKEPYGSKPSSEMIDAGNDLLSLLLNVAMAEPCLKAGDDHGFEIPDAWKPYLFSNEKPSAHVYRKMRAIAAAC